MTYVPKMYYLEPICSHLEMAARLIMMYQIWDEATFKRFSRCQGEKLFHSDLGNTSHFTFPPGHLHYTNTVAAADSNGTNTV